MVWQVGDVKCDDKVFFYSFTPQREVTQRTHIVYSNYLNKSRFTFIHKQNIEHKSVEFIKAEGQNHNSSA